MAKCTGVMAAFIKGSGVVEYNMEKDRFMSLAKDIKKEYFKITFSLLSRENLK